MEIVSYKRGKEYTTKGGDLYFCGDFVEHILGYRPRAVRIEASFEHSKGFETFEVKNICGLPYLVSDKEFLLAPWQFKVLCKPIVGKKVYVRVTDITERVKEALK